jgi:hypothetical protein
MSDNKLITVMREFDRPELFYEKENGKLREEIDILLVVISVRDKEIADLRATLAVLIPEVMHEVDTAATPEWQEAAAKAGLIAWHVKKQGDDDEPGLSEIVGDIDVGDRYWVETAKCRQLRGETP